MSIKSQVGMSLPRANVELQFGRQTRVCYNVGIGERNRTLRKITNIRVTPQIVLRRVAHDVISRHARKSVGSVFAPPHLVLLASARFATSRADHAYHFVRSDVASFTVGIK